MIDIRSCDPYDGSANAREGQMRVPLRSGVRFPGVRLGSRAGGPEEVGQAQGGH